jgi:flagellar basal-body rod modification protein FlgD
MSDIGLSTQPVAVSPARPTETKAATVLPKQELDKDAFLKLLVAQLKYQNPMSPSDPSEFLAQTAQFTMVEKLEELAANSKASGLQGKLSLASGLLGREVGYPKGDGSTITGLVRSARVIDGEVLLRIGADDVKIGDVSSIAPAVVPTTDAAG